MANMRDIFRELLSDQRSGGFFDASLQTSSDVDEDAIDVAEQPAEIKTTVEPVVQRKSAEKEDSRSVSEAIHITKNKNPLNIEFTRNTLLQGIILAEIIAKPVSKRRCLR